MEVGESPKLPDQLRNLLDGTPSDSLAYILRVAVALVPQKNKSDGVLSSSCLLFAVVESGREGKLTTLNEISLDPVISFVANGIANNPEGLYYDVRDNFFGGSAPVIDADLLDTDEGFEPTPNTRKILSDASMLAQADQPSALVDMRHLVRALLAARETGAIKQLQRMNIDPDKLLRSVEEFLSTSPPPRPEESYPEAQVPLHTDHPARIDQLGRRAFARALARRLRRIVLASREAEVDEAFMVHLHAPWGAGKTTLMNFLQEELSPAPEEKNFWVPPEPRPWIVIKFNAWQNQYVDPPWWTFMDTVFRQAREQLRLRFYWRSRAWCLSRNEYFWRLTAGKRHYILAFAIIVLMFAFVIWLYAAQATDGTSISAPAVADGTIAPTVSATGDADGQNGLGPFAKSLGTMLALLTTIWTIAQVISRTLIPGSASAARNFVQVSSDPMEHLRKHFKALVRHIEEPILVLIDDLDRCNPKFVVNFLEGIQTLFRDASVVFVVAGDRRWIYTCYEKSYADFKDRVNEPGRPIGYLFLEKAFQISVSLPRLSEEMRDRFWNSLIRVRTTDVEKSIADATLAARAEIRQIETPDQISEALNKARSGLDDVLFREQLVERMSERDIEEQTEHFLEAFAPLLEPNPRAMKRLVNAFGLHEALAILAGLPVGQTEVRKQLALWTILALRWPRLEEILEERPEIVDEIGPGLKLPEELRKRLPCDVVTVLEMPEVRAVISGDRVAARLDVRAIDQFSRLRSSGSPVSSVA